MRALRDGAGEGGAAAHRHPVHLALQALDDHRGDVAAAVLAVVDDEGFLVQLRIVVPGPFVQAFGAHVRDVDVPHLAAGLFLHGLDVLQDPLVVVERVFVGDGLDHHLLAADGEFGEDIGLAHEELVHVVHVLEGHAVDGGDDIAFLHAEARLLERGTEFRPVGRALEDAVDAVAVLDLGELGAEQAHRDARRLRIVGRGGDVGVAAGDFGDHLADDVVHVQPRLGVRNQDLILGLDGLPVASMHIFQVVAVAEGAPDLVEKLGPFLAVVDRRDEAVEGHLVLQAHLRAGGGHIQVAALHEDGLLVAAADRHPGVDAVLVLARGEVEDAGTAAAAVPELGTVAIEAPAIDRELDDAVQDAVRVDLHGLRAGGLVGLRLRGLAALGRLGLRGLLRRVRLDLHFRVLGDQRRRRILGEHRHIDAGHVAIGVVPLDVAVLRVQVAVGGENQILAVRAEGGAAAVVPALGHRIFLALGEVVQVDDVHLVLGRAGVGDPLAVRGVLHAAELGFGILHHGAAGLREGIDLHEAVLAVAVQDVLAVRAPLEGADVGVGALRHLDRVAALHRVIKVDFSLAGGVADPGDPLAVRAPDRAAVVGAGRPADVAGDAGLHGHVEDFAAGGHDHPGAVRGQAHARAIAGHGLALRAAVHIVRSERDGDLRGLAGLRVQPVQPASVLEDDGLAVGGGELHVVLLEVGDFLGLLRLRIVHEEVHDHVAVGSEEDLVADPHREDVLGDVFGDVFHLAGLGVIDPHVVRHAAPVVLPGAEFAHHAVVGQFLSVRGPGAETALRERNLRGHPALGPHRPELAGEAVADAVAVDDALPVRGPAHHDVVRAHAVAQVVPAVGGGVGEPYGLAARGRDQVHLAVAVIFAREGDALSVGGVPGEHLVADVRGEPAGDTALDRDGPQVARIGEGDFGAVRGGETQQAGLIGTRGYARGKGRRQRKDRKRMLHIKCLWYSSTNIRKIRDFQSPNRTGFPRPVPSCAASSPGPASRSGTGRGPSGRRT